MNIQEYIKIVHNGNTEWFIDEVDNFVNQKRILDVIRKREYLDGKHAILNRGVENYNGTPYEPRKVILQYGKKVIELETTYLLKNPLTLTGKDDIVSDFKNVYKKGKYNKVDFDILNHIVKYGNAYEYIFMNKYGNIQSKLIQPENAYPIYNDELEMIAFVEYYTSLESDYYIVYYENRVEKYSNVGNGELKLISTFKNVSGLPIHYRNDNEMDLIFGKSDLDDFINIIDSMEDILSKFSDSFYKHHNPIPVVIGQQLVGEGLNPHVIGGGLNLDDGADFKMVSNELNHQAFEVIYKTLKQELINISSTPAVSLNNADVSNLSETSMKILYQLADMKAGINEKYLREGLEQRFEKIILLLNRMGKSYDEDTIESLEMVFHYARPINETDVIENIVKLYEMGAISLESILDIAPLVSDSQRELDRINRQTSESNSDEEVITTD
ncbi:MULTISPECIES: phage portal protein [Lysinibacillus]|uniref:phage portal protein n=1 Tax=Lysinibacillus TaxID=400634 RepID=UPI00214C491E|nr:MULTISPECIES: phage portal protein [Lysinibacillus]UUV26392.1 phage portal protein [Lysinibacillus sp. FN11]UYB49273.1 phage portal protein [Lysinibacillus capsici]